MTKERLPIDEQLPGLIQLVNDNKVVICVAETGAGKTTRIAPALLDNSPNSKVYLTQPQKIACKWNAGRIAEEMGETVGGTAGFWLRNERKVSKDTKIELLIDQSLLNRIRKQRKLPEGIIVIDEIHERSLSIDLLLAVIKKYIGSSSNTKVVLISATVNTEQLSKYFHNAPIHVVLGRCYQVEVKRHYLENRKHHTEGTFDAAKNVIEKFQLGELTTMSENQKRQVVAKGVLIILLPGKADVEIVYKKLEKLEEGVRKNFRVFQCTGSSSKKEINDARSIPDDGKLHIVCGTEILRNSVTIPFTVGVIDSLQVKRIQKSESGFYDLEKIAISKADAKQAEGRAGRTAPGFYIPVGNEYDYLKDWPIPAIEREPLQGVVLQVVAFGFKILDFEFIDPPSPLQIGIAEKSLQVYGALDAVKNITKLGKFLLGYSLDPKDALILEHAKIHKVLPEIIVLLSIFHAEGIFTKTPTKAMRSEVCCDHNNDFAYIVTIYRRYKRQEHKGPRILNSYCKDNFLDLNKIVKAEMKMNDLLNEVSDLKKSDLKKEREFNPNDLVKSLLTAMYEKISGKFEVDSRIYRASNAFKLCNESLCPKKSEVILFQHQVKKHKSMPIVHFAAPVDKQTLRKVLPLLVDTVVGSPTFDFEKDRTVQTQRFLFNHNIDLGTEQLAPTLETQKNTFLKWVIETIYSNNERMKDCYPELSHVIQKNMGLREQIKCLPDEKRQQILESWSRARLLLHYSELMHAAVCIANVRTFDHFLLPDFQEIEMEVAAYQRKQIEEQLRKVQMEKQKDSWCNVM